MLFAVSSVLLLFIYFFNVLTGLLKWGKNVKNLLNGVFAVANVKLRG